MISFAIFDFVDNWPLWAQLAAYVVGLALGTFCLVKFCDFFVEASSAIAKKLKISPMIIGLTIVAMGTSLPELAVSTSDSIASLMEGGHANVAIGNVIGSNLCNLLLVLGVSVLVSPIAISKSTVRKEFPILLGISALFVMFVLCFHLDGNVAITRWEAIVLVVGIVAYLTYLVISAKKHPEEVEVEEINDMPWWKAIVLTVVGAAGIMIGGELVVFGAKGLALQGALAINVDHDLAESLVGLTIVAVGTSLPELVTSVVASKKGEKEIALGNVIGSNIFNTLFVLGIAGTINPLTSGNQVIVDVIVMMAATILVFVLSLNQKLAKRDGILFIVIYVGYLAYLITRTLIGA